MHLDCGIRGRRVFWHLGFGRQRRLVLNIRMAQPALHLFARGVAISFAAMSAENGIGICCDLVPWGSDIISGL